jgi:hypothetical protein
MAEYVIGNVSSLVDSFRDQFGGYSDFKNQYGANHPFYFNKNCQIVRRDNDTQPLCGYIGVAYSPISLLWTNEVDIEHVGKVAKFKLNPYGSDEWTIWKGSKNTPLLV